MAPIFRYRYGWAHEQLGPLWQELGVPHLDLLKVYGGLAPAKITVNRFDAHPNELAHELAAKEISIFLNQLH